MMISRRTMLTTLSLAVAGAAFPGARASAQSSPLVGTWRTRTGHSITYFRFDPNGTVTMQFFKEGPGYYGQGALVFGETGRYRFGGGILEYQFTRWFGGVIKPPDFGVARRVAIQFQGTNAFMTGDGAYYVREL
jgi:hypothetical protein